VGDILGRRDVLHPMSMDGDPLPEAADIDLERERR